MVMPPVQFGPPPPPLSYSVHTIRVSNHAHQVTRGSLLDRGANGSVLGSDAKVILTYERTVDVSGIDNHEMTGLRIVDASAKVMTHRGPVILIMRQYAYHGTGRTIHSCIQLEHYKTVVHDKSIKAGGRQCVITLEGYIIPLDIIRGLPYMQMEPNTQEEWETLPHIILTSGDEWVPSVFDYRLSQEDDWINQLKDLDPGTLDGNFDQFGNFKDREPVSAVTIVPPINPDPEAIVDDDEIENDYHDLRVCLTELSDLNRIYVFDTEIDDDAEMSKDVQCGKASLKIRRKNYERYRPYFLHVPVEKVKKTFENTTQHAARVVSGERIYHTHKSPFPAHNVPRRNEPVASDTIFGACPAIGTNGQTLAQVYVGRKSLVIDVYGMHKMSHFINTLEDVVRKRGAMDLLLTDSAKTEMSKRVIDFLRNYLILDHRSEPHYQNQNYSERRYQNLRRNLRWYMNWRNVPPEFWLLCLEWCADVMNHTAEQSLGWRTPLSVLTGQTTDISIILMFLFCDLVYCSRYPDDKCNGKPGSAKADEIRGRFVGFAWNVGHTLTFKVYNEDSGHILERSMIRLATDDSNNNLKLDAQHGANPERVYTVGKFDDKVFSDDEAVRDSLVLPTIDMSDIPSDEFKSPSDSPPASEDTTPSPDVLQPTVDIDEDTPAIPQDTTTPQPPVVETVLEDDDQSSDDVPTPSSDVHYPLPRDEPHAPMDDPPLSARPVVETVDPEEDLAPHNQEAARRADGERIEIDEQTKPIDFSNAPLDTPNFVMKARLPPDQLVDRTFLMPDNPDGSRYRAKIVEAINLHKDGMLNNPDLIRFKCLVNKDYEEVVAYNDIIDYIEDDETWRDDSIFKFREIIDHAIVKPSDKKNYKGCKYNLLVLWETGEKTWEPLTRFDGAGVMDTDPTTVAIYARKSGLLNDPEWKHPTLRRIAKTEKRMQRRMHQSHLHSFRTKPIYMYGILVPRNYQQAIEIDKENGNTLWQDATALELKQQDDYKTFLDKGKGYKPGPDYKKITVHLVYACKHDGRRKARLVAGGHLTATPIDSVYSSVVSLRGIRMLTFIAELNDLDLWVTDIGNAYLESYTKEKVYITAGPEFGDRAGHTLIIVKALYGLKSSGLRWHERLADVLRSMGFFPSRAEPDIWMRGKGDHYEYIAVYVDDLLILSKEPQAIVDTLLQDYDFKLKGTGPIEFHLGCDFLRDEDGVLRYAPLKYIAKSLEEYKRLFGSYPKQYASPLEKGDHPELDSSPELDLEQTKIYQSLIGVLQWAIQIGRMDLCTSVMTMSRFRVAPRQGHLDRVKRIFGYLSKMRHGSVRIRTEEPDFSSIPEKFCDWEQTCYAGAEEDLPRDAPRPLGKRVITSSYVDANLYHDLISGRSVTGILHFFNKTPIDWYSKLQSLAASATFGSEYVAGRTATDQIQDLRNTLRYLGVPVEGPSFLFGDNESVVNTASIPHSRLTKRHYMLPYHVCRQAIAARWLRFHFIRGKTNPADVLSKHWDYASIWPLLKPLLFWAGDTADLVTAPKSDDSTDKGANTPDSPSPSSA